MRIKVGSKIRVINEKKSERNGLKKSYWDCNRR